MRGGGGCFSDPRARQANRFAQRPEVCDSTRATGARLKLCQAKPSGASRQKFPFQPLRPHDAHAIACSVSGNIKKGFLTGVAKPTRLAP